MSDPGAWTRWGPPPEPNPGTPVRRLGPAKVTRLVNIGFRIFRRNWKPLVASALLLGGLGLIIGELASARLNDVLAPLLVIDSSGVSRFIGTDADVPVIGWALLASIAGTYAASACLTIASLVASLYVNHDYRGGTISLRVAVAHALRRAPVAFAAWLLNTLVFFAVVALMLILAVGAIRLLPGDAGSAGGLGVLFALVVAVAGVVVLVAVSVRWAVFSAVIALEPVGPVHALRRSWHLTADNAWRIFGLELLVVLLVSIVATILSTIVNVLVVGGPEAGMLHLTLTVVLGVLVSALTVQVLPVVLTVLYFDLRVRRDQLDLPLDPQR